MPRRSTYRLPKAELDPAYTKWVARFGRSLAAENKSPRTTQTYLESLTRFGEYLASQGLSQDPAAITREQVRLFLEALVAPGHFSAKTALNRFEGIRAFFKWLVADEHLAQSPVHNMKPPFVPEAPVVPFTEEELRRLLKACEGNAFSERRDLAIMRLLIDTPIRREEMATLRLNDLDLELRVVGVMGKGRRPRAMPYGHKMAKVLDRYLDAREDHPDATEPWLWLGQRGRLTPSGVHQILKTRALQAHVDDIHPHRFRHSFADDYLEHGGQESDLMMLAGWRSHASLRRYIAGRAAARARENYHAGRSPGDRL
jgi:site-specific recombinase XerD